jgi:hypothetical protein
MPPELAPPLAVLPPVETTSAPSWPLLQAKNPEMVSNPKTDSSGLFESSRRLVDCRTEEVS